jgi:predicted nuclease of restriction endonuclease-like (RecB) superfamily
MGRVPVQSAGDEGLYQGILQVLEQARASAYRAVSFAMVLAYWQVGRLIVEHDQHGRKRASYGEALLEELSRRLTQDFGRGYTTTNLRYMRQFYLLFPIHHALRDKSDSSSKQQASRSKHASRHSARDESTPSGTDLARVLRPELSWTHYRLLLRVESSKAREWYMHEAAEQNWSSRQLDRQISVLYYERLLASRDALSVREEAGHELAAIAPEHFIRDPYVLEFLDLKDYPALRESVVEQAIIENLQAFLLELGRGFCFVARQKRMRFEDEGEQASVRGSVYGLPAHGGGAPARVGARKAAD